MAQVDLESGFATDWRTTIDAAISAARTTYFVPGLDGTEIDTYGTSTVASGDRRYRSTTLYFGGTTHAYSNLEIDGATPISIGSVKNLHFRCDSPDQVRLGWNGTGNYMFNIGGSWTTVTFENLIFSGGGISVDGSHRRPIKFINCGFANTPGAVVTALGTSVVGVEFHNCWFDECAGIVDVQYGACDGWKMYNCIVKKVTGLTLAGGAKVGGIFQSPGLVVVNTDFEQVDNSGGDFLAWWQLEFGLNIFQINKFRGEVSSGWMPPKYNILIGSEDGQDSGTLDGFWFSGNQHFSRDGGSTSTSGQSAFALHSAVKGSLIADYVQNMNGHIVTENFSSNSSPANNIWGMNPLSPQFSGSGVFSNGGQGWHEKYGPGF